MKLEQKTIVIVAPYFPPDGGGLERYAYEIAIRLQKNYGWRVVIITSGKRHGQDIKEEMDGLTVYRLSYKIKVSNTPFSFGWYGKIKKILKYEKPNIINIHMPVPGIGDVVSLVNKKTPVIITYHAGSMRKGQFLSDIFVWFYENIILPKLLKKADHIVCSSDFIRFQFLEQYTTKSTTITPGVDIGLFKPDLIQKTKKPSILFVAGLGWTEQHKGLLKVLEATKKIKEVTPSIHLFVVGDGDMREEYEKRVKILGLEKSVTFTGRLSGIELAKKYQQAHIFVLPSINESFSMVILEAMSSGLAVVAANTGGIPSLVLNNKTGFLIPQNDKGDLLAEKLSELIKNTELCINLGKTGQNRVKQEFSWESRVTQYENLINLEIRKFPLIVQISPYYPPHLGGLELVAKNISETLAEQNNNVLVLSSNNNLKTFVEKNKNITVKRLASFNFAHTPISPTLLWHLLRLPKKSIIHFHLAQAYWLELMFVVAKLKRIPYIIHFHGDVVPSGIFGKLFILYKKYIQSFILRGAEKIIVLSEEQITFISEVNKVPISKIIFVPNGVDEIFSTITKLRTKHSNSLKILFVGRISVQKRVDRLIEAMNILKIPAQLTIVGEGEEREKMENLTKTLNLKNVTFVGRKTKEELLKYYSDSDMFVLSSVFEGMPLVVLEAMATGLPIMGSNVQGIRELINNVGVLVDNPSPEKFAQEIEKIAENPIKLEELSRKSIEKSKEYSWGKTVDMIKNIYLEILK